jgi:hypothetical protein
MWLVFHFLLARRAAGLVGAAGPLGA